MAHDLAFYLREGAEKLRNVPLAFASSGSDHKFDRRYWKRSGRRMLGANVLVPVDPDNPAEAVQTIFDHPDRWQFDCSQFVQVVNYYAWLKVIDDPADFNSKVIRSGGIKIQPFIGAVFTARIHYYRRESRDEWMKYRPNGDRSKEQQTCMTAWDIIGAAPVGSRVNFTNDRAPADSGWRYENTVKVSRNEFIAHHGQGGTNVFKAKDLITYIYRAGTGRSTADYAEADRHVWIKEVEYHFEVPSPVTCPR